MSAHRLPLALRHRLSEGCEFLCTCYQKAVSRGAGYCFSTGKSPTVIWGEDVGTLSSNNGQERPWQGKAGWRECESQVVPDPEDFLQCF